MATVPYLRVLETQARNEPMSGSQTAARSLQRRLGSTSPSLSRDQFIVVGLLCDWSQTQPELLCDLVPYDNTRLCYNTKENAPPLCPVCNTLLLRSLLQLCIGNGTDEWMSEVRSWCTNLFSTVKRETARHEFIQNTTSCSRSLLLPPAASCVSLNETRSRAAAAAMERC